MGCGPVDFVDGGTLSHVTVTGSSILSSSLTGCTIESSDIVSLRSVDEVSSLVLANALAALSPAQLKVLADAIDAARTITSADTPGAVDGETLGTKVIGDRGTLLGAPDDWVNIGGKAVPAY